MFDIFLEKQFFPVSPWQDVFSWRFGRNRFKFKGDSQKNYKEGKNYKIMNEDKRTFKKNQRFVNDVIWKMSHK